MNSLPPWAIIAGIGLVVLTAAAWLIARRRGKRAGRPGKKHNLPDARKEVFDEDSGDRKAGWRDGYHWLSRSRRPGEEPDTAGSAGAEWPPWSDGDRDAAESSEGSAGGSASDTWSSEEWGEPPARPASEWAGDPEFPGGGDGGGESAAPPESPAPEAEEPEIPPALVEREDGYWRGRVLGEAPEPPGAAAEWEEAAPLESPAPEPKENSASPPPPASAPPAMPISQPESGGGRFDLPEPEANEYRVWFGTNRMPVDPADPSRGFSGARDQITRYGHCDIFVPESHKIGSIGSSWLRRLVTRTDDRLKLCRLGVLGRGAYWQAVGRQLAEQPAGLRHAVVFIHGYNVSFEEAAIRAAQIGFDLGVGGAMAFFSWPSRGKTGHYLADGAAIEASEAAIADFLADFGRKTGADLVHVIAHSMGNRGLLRAINRIFADAERQSGCNFGEFILAAPDVDADTFRQLAQAYHQMGARTTLYVSGRDRAVELSKWIYDYPRVGFEPPISIFDNIDTISVTNVDLTLLGHGYVAEARPVLNDMHAIIFRGDPPEKRPFLKERRAADGRRYWEVRG